MAESQKIDEFTQLLAAAELGEPMASEQLLPLVYDELRKLAAQKMASEAPGHTLQPTALVHEAWLRLTGGEEQRWNGRGHFFAAAAEAMRRILIEHARKKAAAKRGGKPERVDLENVVIATETKPEVLLILDDALQMLGVEDPRSAELIKMNFFLGFSFEKAAKILGISESTASREWTKARLRMHELMTQKML